jgi:hypothetical protein
MASPSSGAGRNEETPCKVAETTVHNHTIFQLIALLSILSNRSFNFGQYLLLYELLANLAS